MTNLNNFAKYFTNNGYFTKIYKERSWYQGKNKVIK